MRTSPPSRRSGSRAPAPESGPGGKRKGGSGSTGDLKPAAALPVDSSSGRGWLALGLLAVVLGAGFRLLAARGDLWLDEILTFSYTQAMHSPLDALFTVYSDNNHILNTIWFYILGPHRPDIVYRLPAVLAGSLSILLAGWINAAQSAPGDGNARVRRRAFAIGAVLFAASYLMLHYDSEARGYALAIAFGFLAVAAALQERSWGVGRWTFLYGTSMSLALLAHPLAIHILMGGAAWQAVEAFERERVRPVKVAAVRFLAWQGPPLAFLAFFYWVHLRHMVVLGGPRLNPMAVLGSAASFTFGLPPSPKLGIIGLVVLLSVGLTVLVLGARRSAPSKSRGLWALYLTSGLVSPALLVARTPDGLTYERYFMVSLAMLLLLAAAALTRLAGKVAVALLLTLFVAGNLPAASRLIHEGRGHYRAALAVMARDDDASVVTVGGISDLQEGTLVDYFGPEMIGPGRRIAYVPAAHVVAAPPDWFLWGWQTQDPRPPADFQIETGAQFQSVGTYPCAQLSGFNWTLYRRSERR